MESYPDKRVTQLRTDGVHYRKFVVSKQITSVLLLYILWTRFFPPTYVCTSVKRLLRVCVCVFSSHLLWTSSPLDVGLTQDFSSTFHLRCVPYFLSREGSSHSFPSSAVKSNLCTKNLIVLHSLGIFMILLFIFKREKCSFQKESVICEWLIGIS